MVKSLILSIIVIIKQFEQLRKYQRLQNHSKLDDGKIDFSFQISD